MSDIKPLLYKGKPLVRQGQYLFYGDPEDKAILFMNILETVSYTHLRQRIAFNERMEENPQDALEEYIRLKRQKKTRPGDGGEA